MSRRIGQPLDRGWLGGAIGERARRRDGAAFRRGGRGRGGEIGFVLTVIDAVVQAVHKESVLAGMDRIRSATQEQARANVVVQRSKQFTRVLEGSATEMEQAAGELGREAEALREGVRRFRI